MFIGKWNKSVILTYTGTVVSLLGIYFCFKGYENNINIAMSCLIIAGVCDLFDGKIARKCKRSEEEKNFGIQLDSLADTIDFITLPAAITLSLSFNSWYHFIILSFFTICGIARLAYFNLTTEDNSNPVKYYKGLPVTYTAIIFPVFYLIKYIVDSSIFNIVFTCVIFCIALLNILNIKIKKPKGIAYVFFSLLAIIMLVIYLEVL